MQQLNTQTTPTDTTPSPEGHEAAMIAKVDAAEQALQPKAEAPAGEVKLAGKFSSVEELERSYQELERKLGAAANQPKPEGEGEKGGEASPADLTLDAATDKANDAGIDVQKLTDEYLETGDLSAETRSALVKAGIPEAFIDSHVAGLKAQASLIRTEVLASVGGEAKYSDMVTWAKTALTPAEIDSYNKALTSSDLEAVKTAVQGLAYRFQKAEGVEPNLLGGKLTAAQDIYESSAQVTADMRKPEYATDPAFRAKVQAKLARSNVW